MSCHRTRKSQVDGDIEVNLGSDSADSDVDVIGVVDSESF